MSAHFSYNHCEFLLRKGGAKQASNEAAIELANILELAALEISKKAALFADDEDRFRVIARDVKKGFQEYLEFASLHGEK
ncbi:MAG: histone [Nitrososphaerota archaeon]|jgi:histone H3/H4|nr:histone [Nitrososphaerota archaeon]